MGYLFCLSRPPRGLFAASGELLATHWNNMACSSPLSVNGPPLIVNLQCFNLTRARHSVRKKEEKYKKRKKKQQNNKKSQTHMHTHTHTCSQRSAQKLHSPSHTTTNSNLLWELSRFSLTGFLRMAAHCSLKSLFCHRQPQVTSFLRSLANFTIRNYQSVKLARSKHLVWLETCFDMCRLHAFYPLSYWLYFCPCCFAYGASNTNREKLQVQKPIGPGYNGR